MPQPRTVEIARHFPENGLKLLLENPHNVRDLLRIAGTDLVAWIDFDRLALVPTTFVQRDYRHVESDLILRRRGARSPTGIIVYILIEHQSEPDRLMPFRVVEYVVQILRAQVREWGQQHTSLAGIQLQPVLLVVFYTGRRRWDAVGRLVDLVALGQRFARFIPGLEPLFVNLPAVPPGRLENEGGFLG